MRCCKCNRTGSCKGCACVKAKRLCMDCLPTKLGNCVNTKTTQTESSTNSADAHLPSGSTRPILRPTLEESSLSDLPTPTPNKDIEDIESEPAVKLPTPTPPTAPLFSWGVHSAQDFCPILDATYTEVIHWRRNCFTVPFGNVGKEFVETLF